MNVATQEAINQSLPPRTRVKQALSDGRTNMLLDQVLASRRANPNAHNKSSKPSKSA